MREKGRFKATRLTGEELRQEWIRLGAQDN